MKRLCIIILTVLIATVGCASVNQFNSSLSGAESRDWNLYEESAKNTSVSLAHTYTDENTRKWFEQEFARRLKNDYNISLEIYSGTKEELFGKLEEDEKLEKDFNAYDIVILSEDNFKEFRESDYLYGPFVEKLPHVKLYMNSEDAEYMRDEGMLIKGYEVPFAKSQLVYIANENLLFDKPRTYDELFNIVKRLKGQFIYPDPTKTDEGEAFLISYIESQVGYKKLEEMPRDKDAIQKLIQPQINKLIEMEPYLYNQGTRYPKSMKELDQLYSEGKLLYSMSLNNTYATDKINEYVYPESSYSFIIQEGTTGDVDYAAITKNAENKSGAFVVINELLSPKSQAEIYKNDNLAMLNVYDKQKADKTAYESINKVRVKATSISHSKILPYRLPQLDREIVDIIVEIWKEEVKDI